MMVHTKEAIDLVNYDSLCAQLSALTQDVPYPISNLANASALLWQELPDINWAGFYLAEGNVLYLGPFQGKPACIEIPFGKGVCGTAAAENATQLVPDVHAFPGHIACDSASNSEIVVPIHKNGAVWGVLDIDSPTFNRFTEFDRDGLTQFVTILEKALFG
jgi:GAF domain-containing protein